MHRFERLTPEMIHFKKILIIAGEASGDQHGADLIKELKSKYPNVNFYAMGSHRIRSTGATILVDSTDLGVVGFTEIFKIFNKILKSLKVIKSFISTQKPELVILIDYPGFNLRIAKFAKQQGSKVIYYISPQLWAWRESRVQIIKQSVDLMAVIFPFEVDFYHKHGVKAFYVGNPLLHQLPLELSKEKARERLEFDQNTTLIGLLPGSRKSEIKRMLPIQLEAARLLWEKDRSIKFVLPLAESLIEDDLALYISSSPIPLKITTQQRFAVMKSCDSLIATSGTVTLEAALLGIPMAVAYKGSFLSYHIAKWLVKINFIGLCNIVAGKSVVNEYIQAKATPENLCAETLKIIINHEYSKQIKADLQKIKSILTETPHLSSLMNCIETLVTTASNR